MLPQTPPSQNLAVHAVWVPHGASSPRGPGFPVRRQCQASPSWRFILQSCREGTSRTCCPPADTGSGAEVGPLPSSGQWGKQVQVAACLRTAARGTHRATALPASSSHGRPHAQVTGAPSCHVGSASRMPWMPASTGSALRRGTQADAPHHPWLHPSLIHSASVHLVPPAWKGNETNVMCARCLAE